MSFNDQDLSNDNQSLFTVLDDFGGRIGLLMNKWNIYENDDIELIISDVCDHDDIELIISEDVKCSNGYMKIDTALISGHVNKNYYICCKRAEQSEPLLGETVIDLDIHLNNQGFS